MPTFESPGNQESDLFREQFGEMERMRYRAQFEALVPAYEELSRYESKILGEGERTSIQEFMKYAYPDTEDLGDEVDDEENQRRVEKRMLSALQTDRAFREAFIQFQIAHRNATEKEWAEILTEWFPGEALPDFLREE